MREQDKAEDSQEETEIAEIKNDYETDTGDNDEVDKESDDVDKTEDVSQEEDESEVINCVSLLYVRCWISLITILYICTICLG